MRAMILRQPRTRLELVELPLPEPKRGELRVRVEACALCRTDLHVVDGELPDPKLPVTPGHQIAGLVDGIGDGVDDFAAGDRVGIPWVGWTCGACHFCVSGRENLCDRARFTGYTIDGGYADFAIADARFSFRLPDGYSAEEAAPLLCAGLIGYRALRMAGDGRRLGFYGYGSAAQILAQVANGEGREVFAFTRRSDVEGQAFAMTMGAVWAGGSDDAPPEELDAAIIFAPAGPLVVTALSHVAKGGTVVCAGIHMSDIPSFPYALLWGERTVRSVANLTREDGLRFFERARAMRIETRRRTFPLHQANEALDALRAGEIVGSAVLEC